jgi:hypothetical protein
MIARLPEPRRLSSRPGARGHLLERRLDLPRLIGAERIQIALDLRDIDGVDLPQNSRMLENAVDGAGWRRELLNARAAVIGASMGMLRESVAILSGQLEAVEVAT